MIQIIDSFYYINRIESTIESDDSLTAWMPPKKYKEFIFKIIHFNSNLKIKISSSMKTLETARISFRFLPLNLI